MNFHKTEITSGPKGHRWECSCGTAGAWARNYTHQVADRGKFHEDKYNREGLL
jgi:hypothetical protein